MEEQCTRAGRNGLSRERFGRGLRKRFGHGLSRERFGHGLSSERFGRGLRKRQRMIR